MVLFFCLGNIYLHATPRNWVGRGSILATTTGTDIASAANWNGGTALLPGDTYTMTLGTASGTWSLTQSAALTMAAFTITLNTSSSTFRSYSVNISKNLNISGAFIIANTCIGDNDHEVKINITAGTTSCASFTTNATGSGGLFSTPLLALTLSNGDVFSCSGALISNCTSTSTTLTELTVNGTFSCSSVSIVSDGVGNFWDPYIDYTIGTTGNFNCSGSWNTSAASTSYTETDINNSGTLTIGGTTTATSSGNYGVYFLVGNSPATTTFNGNASFGSSAPLYFIFFVLNPTTLGGISANATGKFVFKADLTLGQTMGTETNFNPNGVFLFDGTGTQTVTDNSNALYIVPGTLQIGSTNNPTVNFVKGTSLFADGMDIYTSLVVNGSSTLSVGLGETLNSYNYTLFGTNSGTLSLNSTGTLQLAGTTGGQTGSNFPRGYTSYTLAAGSTAEYNATAAQTVYSGVTYGNLTLTNNATKTSGGAITAVGSIKINNTSVFDVSASNYATTVGGNFTNNGNFTQRSGTVTFNGSTNATLDGTTATSFYSFVLNKNAVSNRIVMGNSVTVTNNLTLTKGIIVTGAGNLFTWNNTGTLTSPTGSSYANSFIATCNSNGTSLSITSPYDGAVGFRINNVLSGTGDSLFPVGATYLNAGSFTATPNRMIIHNTGVVDFFTVVVNKELLPNTPLPGINRVWYVKEGSSAGSKVNMKLYFTKRTSTNFPLTQDEVEPGFLWSDPHLVQENYSSQFTNNSKLGLPLSGGDTPDFIGGFIDGDEIYGQYRRLVSPDLFGGLNGITDFTRFSVVNASTIILPVSVINLKAYQKGNTIRLDFTALNELNMNNYTAERSLDGINFQTIIKTIAARNNGIQQNNYNIIDEAPLSGKNFYRIKVVDKNGAMSYTTIVFVDITKGIPGIAVQPNPVPGRQAMLLMNNIPTGSYNLIVYNNLGQKIHTQVITHTGGSATKIIVLPEGTLTGLYILRLLGQNANYSTNVLVK